MNEAKKEYRKRYYEKNKEKINAYRRDWWARNREKNSTKRRKQYAEDKVKYLGQKAKDYRKHKKKRLTYAKKYREENKSKIQIWTEKWRAENKERMKVYGREYFKSENGKLVHYRNKLKRRSYENFSLTKEEIKMIYERDMKCVYCNSLDKLTLDHIIPVFKQGGGHFNNFVVACKSCNSSKGGKDVFEWCNRKKIIVPQIVILLLKRKRLIKSNRRLKNE